MKIVSLLRRCRLCRRVYRAIVHRVPFLANLLALYRYSRALEIERRRAWANDNIRHAKDTFAELHRAALAGKLQGHAPKPIIIMTSFNDDDIIEAIIRRNIALGFELILIDNWSADNTWKIIQRMAAGHREEILEIRQYPPDGPSDNYPWKDMLVLKQTLAANYPGRWILHQDSDEITISPFLGIDTATVLRAVASLGYNCVSLRMLDFVPTDDNFTQGDPLEYFRFYRISAIRSYGLQNKIWLQGTEKVDLASQGGHDVSFAGRRILPLRLPRLHYSVRSTAHAARKYSRNRIERTAAERASLGWHTHLDTRANEKVVFRKEELIEFDFAQLYSDMFSVFACDD